MSHQARLVPVNLALHSNEVVMSCVSCASHNEKEFPTEVCIHFESPEDLSRPGVLVFPKLVVCLDCGFSRFTTPEAELVLLGFSIPRFKPGDPVALQTKRQGRVEETGFRDRLDEAV
jgi:hypothetical protein